MQLHVHLLPHLVDSSELSGSTCVVIDVLRATTTITHALAAGAKVILPCLTVEDARRLADGFAPGEVVLGGERGGVKIDGFDFGNSPTDYTPDTVGGMSIVFTTTNGTAAMQHCSQAEQLWLAAFANLSSVCEKLRGAGRINIVCAGTGGQITLEDVLLAGAIVDRLLADPAVAAPTDFNDEARIARLAWQQSVVERAAVAGSVTARVSAALRDTQGGRNLRRLGLEADIDVAAQVDRFSLVPRLMGGAWRIVSD